MSQSPILVFNVTQKDRVKGLYIGCHYKGAVNNTSILAADANSAAIVYGANAAAGFGDH
jgi:hypothetical protein